MKKALIIFFSFIYLALASGILLNVHFCGSNIKKISLFCDNEEDGCCGSKKKSSGCCSDKASFFKVKDDHHSNRSAELIKISFGECLQYSEMILKLTQESSGHKELPHIPPVLYDLPIYIKDRSLLV